MCVGYAFPIVFDVKLVSLSRHFYCLPKCLYLASSKAAVTSGQNPVMPARMGVLPCVLKKGRTISVIAIFYHN